MNKATKQIATSIFFTIVFIVALSLLGIAGDNDGWKAGVARMKITPNESMWMAGYGSRNHPSEGKNQDLWAKALALEDAGGKNVVLITTDLLGFPKDISDNIRDRLQKGYNLSREQIILNSSHTHSGPVLRSSLIDVYPMDSAEWGKVDQYSIWLEDMLYELVGKALSSMKPALLYSGNGLTRFQVNRRNNDEKTLTPQTELKGPNDYAVPVLKVCTPNGKLLAVTFGYACHATVLNGYVWCGDYPGFAQTSLEEQYLGITAMFFQGNGADQNPLPRRSVALTKQYGNELACAVRRVLEEDMKPLPSKLSTAYSEVELQLENPPSEDKLITMIDSLTDYRQRWAKRMLEMKRNGEPIKTTYPYPVEVWNLGGQIMVAMGGETTIGYAINLKKVLGSDIFVMGYSNDVMSYIPTVTILEEGGYEGETSQMVYGLCGKWKPSIESEILGEIKKLAKQVGAEIISEGAK